MKVGDWVRLKGCVTRLLPVMNRSPRYIEDVLGFQRGRLSKGYFLLLLKEKLQPGDFEFFGQTYMSGGRVGLPSDNPALDKSRIKVDQNLRHLLGNDGYEMQQQRLANDFPVSGDQRLVKVYPVVSHDPAVGSATQYPASKLGIAQWNLKKEKLFLVSAAIDGNARFGGGGLDVPIEERTPYDVRAKVARYLESA